MLILKNMISHGRVRACYYHPTDRKLCVKVALQQKHEKLLKKELKYDSLFQKTIGSYVPRYYDIVKTDKGPGLVTDLICDNDKSLSPILADWLNQGKSLNKEIMDQFNDFFFKLFKYRLWFYDFNAANFVIHTCADKQHIFFIDTKSYNRNNSWSTLKLEYIFPFFARRRMLRRIKRFYKIHKQEAPDFSKIAK